MDHSALPPRGPVIGTLTSATRIVEEWLRENDFSTLTDRDGMVWRLESSHSTRPQPGDPQRPIWEIKLALRAEAGPADLVRTGVLDSEGDARMLGLLDGRRVPLAIRPTHFTATSLEAARRFLIGKIPDLKKQLMTESMRDTKRRLVERWLDETSAFCQKA